jgi:putative addiction module component (TIGR02574 family)
MISTADIEQLSVAERIQLVEDIWDTIAANPDALEVSEELGEELDRRVKSYHQNPNAGSSWQDVKQRILSQK